MTSPTPGQALDAAQAAQDAREAADVAALKTQLAGDEAKLTADEAKIASLTAGEQSDAAAIKALQSATVPPAPTPAPAPAPVPAAKPAESADGTIVANTADVITNADGYQYKLTAIPGQVAILKPGATAFTADPASGGIRRLIYTNHQVVQEYQPNLAVAASYWIEPEVGGPGALTTNPITPPPTSPPPVTVGDPTPLQTLNWTGAAGTFPTNVTAELGGNGWGNNELETYTGRAANAACDGAGNLVIKALRETLTGPDGITRNFTSARLNTSKSLVLQPGTYCEIGVNQIPLNQLGAWPALWTVGSDGPWPSAGEIDSPEGSAQSLWQTALHLASTAGNDQQYPWYDAIPASNGPHVDGFYFDGERVQWYLDRKLVRQVVATPAAAAKDSRMIFAGDQPASTSGRVWPFGAHPQYLIFNIAVNNTAFAGATMSIGGVKTWAGTNAPVKIIGG